MEKKLCQEGVLGNTTSGYLIIIVLESQRIHQWFFSIKVNRIAEATPCILENQFAMHSH